MKDPDVLYNMLKNLLAQIKVSVSAEPSGRSRSKKTSIPPQSHPDAWPFMEPVKKSEAPDYYEIIRFPIGQYLLFLKMEDDSPSWRTSSLKFISASLYFVWTLIFSSDLRTMTERLKNRYYVTKKLFIADLQRIISNCREYNHPDSEYCKCANTLEKFFYFKLKDGGLIEK